MKRKSVIFFLLGVMPIMATDVLLDGEALYRKGGTELAAGQTEKAFQSFIAAAKADSANFEISRRIFNLRAMQGEPIFPEESYLQGSWLRFPEMRFYKVQAKPNSLDSLGFIAHAYEDKGNFTKAEKVYSFLSDFGDVSDEYTNDYTNFYENRTQQFREYVELASFLSDNGYYKFAAEELEQAETYLPETDRTALQIQANRFWHERAKALSAYHTFIDSALQSRDTSYVNKTLVDLYTKGEREPWQIALMDSLHISRKDNQEKLIKGAKESLLRQHAMDAYLQLQKINLEKHGIGEQEILSLKNLVRHALVSDYEAQHRDAANIAFKDAMTNGRYERAVIEYNRELRLNTPAAELEKARLKLDSLSNVQQKSIHGGEQ